MRCRVKNEKNSDARRVLAMHHQREFVGRNITPVLMFVKRANYKKRFDFFGIGQRVVASELKPQIDRAVREQMARLLAKRRSGA